MMPPPIPVNTPTERTSKMSSRWVTPTKGTGSRKDHNADHLEDCEQHRQALRDRKKCGIPNARTRSGLLVTACLVRTECTSSHAELSAPWDFTSVSDSPSGTGRLTRSIASSRRRAPWFAGQTHIVVVPGLGSNCRSNRFCRPPCLVGIFCSVTSRSKVDRLFGKLSQPMTTELSWPMTLWNTNVQRTGARM